MKSKAEMMKVLRARRKAEGLVRFEAYVSPELKAKLVKLIESTRVRP